jgi:hypothetical protein
MTSEETRVVNSLAQPVAITITKNSKGYNWEITVHEKDVDNAVLEVERGEKALRLEYGEKS